MLRLIRLLLNIRSLALESFMFHMFLFLQHYCVFFGASAHFFALIGDFSTNGKNFWNNGDFIQRSISSAHIHIESQPFILNSTVQDSFIFYFFLKKTPTASTPWREKFAKTPWFFPTLTLQPLTESEQTFLRWFALADDEGGASCLACAWRWRSRSGQARRGGVGGELAWDGRCRLRRGKAEELLAGL